MRHSLVLGRPARSKRSKRVRSFPNDRYLREYRQGEKIATLGKEGKKKNHREPPLHGILLL